MTNLKVKSMVKVIVRKLTETMEYKGIIVHVSEDHLLLVPFDSVSKNAEAMPIWLKEVETVSSTRFPKEVSNLLKEAYKLYQERLLLEKELAELESQMKKCRENLSDNRLKLEQVTEIINQKRFEIIRSPHDIASKLMRDLEKHDADYIYEPGFASKFVRVYDINADTKMILMTISFVKLIHREYYSELNKRCYDGAEWEALKEKYCPNMQAYLQTEFPFAAVVQVEREIGREEEKFETRYTLELKVSSLTYQEILKMLVSGLNRFKKLYITDSKV
ncbi:hypothetical protein ACFVS2_20125 [Brevibacillus sp. NPDC058079]|uniref:hypothetical protein n=1 Tax=Brevibacillus sp. NPDC058079 TaxID=3346330 RepID=UPI0036ECDFF8